MSTIRERDAAWAEARKLGRQEFPRDWNVMEDRHALLAAGDALAEVADDSSAGAAGYVHRLARSAALAAWKAATG